MKDDPNQIDRMYKAGDSYFELGASLGMKSFDHLITISAAAVAFIFAARSRTDAITDVAIIQLLNLAALCFALCIGFAIWRNYIAGNWFVLKGKRLIESAKIVKGEVSCQCKHDELKGQEDRTQDNRKLCSGASRIFFCLAIIALISGLFKF